MNTAQMRAEGMCEVLWLVEGSLEPFKEVEQVQKAIEEGQKVLDEEGDIQ